jgi:hypothetical protein
MEIYWVAQIIAPLTALLLFRIIWSYLYSPLKSIPGPFWAMFTDLSRFCDFWHENQIWSHQELHRKLGVAVRLGPNLVSLSDPSLLKTIYSTRGDFFKVRFFPSEASIGMSNLSRC